MSVEQKIKDLLARTGAKQLDEAAPQEPIQMQGSSQKADYQAIGTPNSVASAASVKKDQSIATANAGDTTMPKQGGSQDAPHMDRDEDEENQGAKSAATIKPNNLQAQGVGPSPNYQTMADPTAAVTIQNSKGNVAQEEVNVKAELGAIFGEDLSEDFRSKATAIFEAAVIARVNSEMEKISEQLQEQKDAEVLEIKEALVDKIDSFLNYVVENWMEENQLAVESGLRTEIAEDFIGGLKNLFKEHYIEVPEEKYNVLDELQEKANALEAKLNETVEQNIELSKEVTLLRKETILDEMSNGLADTEVEKLKKLVEGVSYDSEDLFREKVKVIKENYFPKAPKSSPEEQILTEEAPVDGGDIMSKYAQALSRSIKAR